MDPLVTVVILLAVLFLLLGLSVWVFVSLFSVALVSIAMFTSAPRARQHRLERQ